MTENDALIEAMALAAWLDLTRDPEGPQDWWGEDDWAEWNEPLRQWHEAPDLCTHIGASGFRSAARAALQAYLTFTQDDGK